jgi:GNAT superfamily N-acetyltransferase
LKWEEYRPDLLEHPDAIKLPAEQIAAGLVIVAEHWGAPAGFAVVLPRDDGNADLDGLFVEPDLWRGGIGSLLVEEAAQFATALEAAALMVVANPRAMKFYAKCGFRECGRTETRFGPAPVMARSLVC